MGSRLDRITDWEAPAREANYCVSTLAVNVCASERQLERYFSHRFGQSPKQWMDALRMADSRRRLREGLMVKEAAEQARFKYVQSFTHAYERVNGARPSDSRGEKSK